MKVLSVIFFSILVLELSGCGSAANATNSIGSSSTIEGTDYSGNYKFAGVQCFQTA